MKAMGKVSRVILLFGLLLLSTNSRAQVFDQGKSYLQIGVGLGAPYVYSGATTIVPPIHISYEYGIKDRWGLGAVLGYTSATYDYPHYVYGYYYQWKFSYTVIGVRGMYHFINTDKGDLYGGLMLGYDVATETFATNDPRWEDPKYYYRGYVLQPSTGGPIIGLFLGGRYMFSPKVGGFAEIGYNDIGFLNLGIVFKF